MKKRPFVTLTKIPNYVVFAITKGVFENIGLLKNSDPTLKMLTKISVLTDNLTAPIHSVALEYYI